MIKYFVNDLTTRFKKMCGTLKSARVVAKEASLKCRNNKVYRIKVVIADSEKDFVTGNYGYISTIAEYRNGEEC